MDYSKTLNLPETDFQMRANLSDREIEILNYWKENNIYFKKLQKADGNIKFILHDGPPYANGVIHLGTALNKILKDVVVKYKSLCGFYAPYVPGWDTHGMPIEHAVLKLLNINRHQIDPLLLRKKCKKYALKYLDIQREDFIRLGVFGDWFNPYITLDSEYEAKQIEVFGNMAKKGHIYKGLKAVYWCIVCETALAEAEIEYVEKKSNSIFVKFLLHKDINNILSGIDINKIYALIWTTTPWTIPANVAIAVNPELEYAIVKYCNEIYIIATKLVDIVMKNNKIENYQILVTIPGYKLEGMKFKHPFFERESPIILGKHVTIEHGTGCVHTAPGHGQEDFDISIKYGLPIISPVDYRGIFTSEGGKFSGLHIDEANILIIKELIDKNKLFSKASIRHQYAHCWRCKKPVIYRATEQWFASLNSFREKAISKIMDVKWIPAWGKERIHKMIVDRQDWCISRQRVWGVPIPIFYCTRCNKYLINDLTINIIKKLFRDETSDIWWTKQASEILPSNVTCEKCGHNDFRKESDIMDVWFDSGSSHFAVLEQRNDLSWPADLYFEGNDQHRGWFQSSLLTSVALRNLAPYKTVLTHGFVVDGDGRKMSKSVGNVLYSHEIIKQYGADILRLWVISADYKSDIRISKDILRQLTEVYRKIRNTFRYMLGNINDFVPNKNKIEYKNLMEIDRWALMRLEQVREKVTKAYEEYEFHILYYIIYNFCIIDLSSIYFDIIKDRLYTELSNSVERRAAQTVLYEILNTLTIILSPVLSFTTEEVWRYIPKNPHMPISVQLADWPVARSEFIDIELEKKWIYILEIRNELTKALEIARKNKIIGHSLSASIIVYADDTIFEKLLIIKEELALVLIISKIEIIKNMRNTFKNIYKSKIFDFSVDIQVSEGEKCDRCWIYSTKTVHDEENKTLCQRCLRVISQIK